MKSKGQTNYSSKELKSIKAMVATNKNSFKPLSKRKLATLVANTINRPVTGVYYKLLSMPQKRTYTKRTKEVTTTTPIVSMKKSISFGKPTKIEISDNGMTFYF